MKKWEPRADDYLAVFEGQNPWHSLGKVPTEYAKSVRRPLARVLWKLLLHPRIRRYQLILGPRRVGKTTVMYQTVQELIDADVDPKRLWWLKLDHPLLIGLPLGEILGCVMRNSSATHQQPAFAFLDELTYAEDWALWLKTAYDEQWPLQIVGTSSAVSAMKQSGAESGVGRWEEQYLAPYLFSEFLDLTGRAFPRFSAERTFAETIKAAIEGDQTCPTYDGERRRFVLTGGFPELLTAPSSGDEQSDLLRSQTILKSDAIERAIYKDIPQTAPIQDPTKLERLLYILAGQIAGVFSPNAVAADLEMSPRTVEQYASYLERAFLIFSIPNFSPSEETIRRRGKKVYFVDGAVRNAALLRGLAPLSNPSEMGILLENLAAAHLVSLGRHSGIRLFHWRRSTQEVDLLYEQPDAPLAFDIASSSGHTKKCLRSLMDAHAKYRGNCYVVYPSAQIRRPTIDEPGQIPLDLFLLLIGEQACHVLEERVMINQPQRPAYIQRSLFDDLG